LTAEGTCKYRTSSRNRKVSQSFLHLLEDQAKI